MKSLYKTLDLLPGTQLELPNSSLPFHNPKPILQQTKSDITTNPFIIETIDTESITNERHETISTSMSMSFIGLLDDLCNKPDNYNWYDYLRIIIVKDNRYTFIAILFFIIALYILLIK